MGSQVVGYVGALIAVLFFGSNFVVTKKYKSGNGLYFQFIMCSAVVLTGLIHYIVLCKTTTDDSGNYSCPPFEPLAMLGGAIWCLGNIWVVPIVSSIGLGLGIAIWGSSNMLIGWASGRWGILGAAQSPIANSMLNDIGVGLAVAAMLTFFMIKSNVGDEKEGADNKTTTYSQLAAEANDSLDLPKYNAGRASALMAASLNAQDRADELGYSAGGEHAGDEEKSFVDKLSPTQKKIFGLTMAVVSGLCYGVNFNPPSYASSHYYYPGHTGQMKNLYSYAFAHFTGIFLTSTFFFILYCLLSKNSPKLYPEISAPGFASGVIWAIAQLAFFYANNDLGLVVSFPIIAVGPGLVGSLWAAIVFREITGLRNYLLLALAFCFVLGASLCMAFSASS